MTSLVSVLDQTVRSLSDRLLDVSQLDLGAHVGDAKLHVGTELVVVVVVLGGDFIIVELFDSSLLVREDVNVKVGGVELGLECDLRVLDSNRTLARSCL